MDFGTKIKPFWSSRALGQRKCDFVQMLVFLSESIGFEMSGSPKRFNIESESDARCDFDFDAFSNQFRIDFDLRIESIFKDVERLRDLSEISGNQHGTLIRSEKFSTNSVFEGVSSSVRTDPIT